jgi:hypothetical protein
MLEQIVVKILFSARSFTYHVVLDNTDPVWRKNCSETLHLVYPIHISGTFAYTPTLAHTLYLIIFRALQRRFTDVFKLLDGCVSDTKLNGQVSIDDLQ